MAPDAPLLEVQPRTPALGADVFGVELASPLGAGAVTEIRRVLGRYKVVRFPGQHLDADQLAAFASCLGEVVPQPASVMDGQPTDPMRPADQRAQTIVHDESRRRGLDNLWHTDSSFHRVPPAYTVVRAVETPSVGGDTMFADMVAAYDGLSPTLRTMLDGLKGVHDVAATITEFYESSDIDAARRRYPVVEHPLVRTHPETGARALYACRPVTTHVAGLSPDESRSLLDLVCAQVTVPEYQCRFHFETGDVAVWDNRLVQHYAVLDYLPARRMLERVIIAGEVPR